MASKTASRKATRQPMFTRNQRKATGKKKQRTGMLPWVLVGTTAVALFRVFKKTDWRNKSSNFPTERADVSTVP